jgi:hypothetical protein
VRVTVVFRPGETLTPLGGQGQAPTRVALQSPSAVVLAERSAPFLTVREISGPTSDLTMLPYVHGLSSVRRKLNENTEYT